MQPNPASSPSVLPPLHSRHGLYLTLLQVSLAVGAVYDGAMAGLLALWPEQFAALLNVPLPGEDFYRLLLALLLGMLSLFYLLAAYDPVAYAGNVVVAILGRSGGTLILVTAAWSHPHLHGLWLPAGVEALFVLSHLVGWWGSRRWR